jgi:hypothetical protein
MGKIQAHYVDPSGKVVADEHDRKVDFIRRLRTARDGQMLEQGEGEAFLLDEVADYLDGNPWQ